jgi:hypothetical protein
MSSRDGHDFSALRMTVSFRLPRERLHQGVTRGNYLAGRLPGPPPHPQGTQNKSTEEHDNADDQQVQQALRDHAHDAQRGPAVTFGWPGTRGRAWRRGSRRKVPPQR